MTLGLAHTMQGGSGPANWPQLTVPEVAAVLAHWGLRNDAPRLRWHSPRPLSSAVIVDAAEQVDGAERVDQNSGRMCGKSSTSRIDGELVKSITMRSTPNPKPAVGGIPYSRART